MNKLPYDYDLNRFKDKMNNEVMPSVPAEVRPIMMTMLVKAYTEGYQQCEEDYKTESGI